MLVNLKNFAVIGDFDEALFIDGVDYDYCFRARMLGLAVVRFATIFSIHSVGREVYRASIKSIFLLRKRKEIHSPLRCYYMYRNMLYLEKKYRQFEPVYYKQIRGYVLSRIKVCLLYGRQTLQILRYLQKARHDFRQNRMGKIKLEIDHKRAKTRTV